MADFVTIPLGKEIGLGRSVVEKKVSEEEIRGDMGVQCVYGGSCPDKCYSDSRSTSADLQVISLEIPGSLFQIYQI